VKKLWVRHWVPIDIFLSVSAVSDNIVRSFQTNVYFLIGHINLWTANIVNLFGLKSKQIIWSAFRPIDFKEQIFVNCGHFHFLNLIVKLSPSIDYERWWRAVILLWQCSLRIWLLCSFLVHVWKTGNFIYIILIIYFIKPKLWTI